jgi:hypothetical protein
MDSICAYEGKSGSCCQVGKRPILGNQGHSHVYVGALADEKASRPKFDRSSAG